MPVRVPRLEMPPNRCAFTLRHEDPEGFFLGETLSGWDPKAAISVSYARSLARELGYVHPDEHARVLAEIDQLATELADARTELQEYDAKFSAIDLLESEGFRARKKPGRKPAEREVAA